MLPEAFLQNLEELRRNLLLRQVQDRDTPFRSGEQTAAGLSRIMVDGIEYINFGSNDYLGFSGQPSLAQAAKNAIDRYGVAAGASRLLAGGTALHKHLEEMVARFKGTEAALLFNSGYSANTSAVPALAQIVDVVVSDELNHASIIDGVRLSRVRRLIYRHNDVSHLSEILRKEGDARKMVISDTVFSMDGDIAPLPEIYALCERHEALLYVDDAHGTGVLGDGQGALTHFRLRPASWIIQMGTFSKALGSYGGFIAAGRPIIDWLMNACRGFIFSTALPACIVAASLQSLKVLQEHAAPLRKLWLNRSRLVEGLTRLGFNLLSTGTPIVPVVVGDVETTVSVSDTLRKHRIYAPAIRPPSVQFPRLRISVSAAHTDEDIDALLEALSQARSE